MTDFRKAMKYALIYGFIGAVVIPLSFEVYANIAHTAGLILTACLVVFAGVKFGSLHAKSMLLGITTFLIFCSMFGFLVFFPLHQFTVGFLNDHSQYFYLTTAEIGAFLLKTGVMLLMTLVVAGAKIGWVRFLEKARHNAEDAGRFIDHAFDEDAPAEQSHEESK